MSTGWPQDVRRPYADDREDRPRGGVALDHPSGPLPAGRQAEFGPNHPSGPLPVGQPRSRGRGLRRGREDEPLNDADYDWIKYLGAAGPAQEPFGGSTGRGTPGGHRDEPPASRARDTRALAPQPSQPGATDLPRRSPQSLSRGDGHAAGPRIPRQAVRAPDPRFTDGRQRERSSWPEDSRWPSTGGRSEGWPTAPQRRHAAASGPGPIAQHRPEPQPDLDRPAGPEGLLLPGDGLGLRGASRSATLTEPWPPGDRVAPDAQGRAAAAPEAAAVPARKAGLVRPARRDRKLAAVKQNRSAASRTPHAASGSRAAAPAGTQTLPRQAVGDRARGEALAPVKTAPRPAPAPADRPRKAQAKAAAVKAASLKTASPRLVTAKPAAPPQKSKIAPAKSGRHRVVRRSVLLVGGASAAAAAAVFAADLMPAGPAHAISTPVRLFDYVQEPLATQTGAAALRAEILARANGEASHVVDAVYEAKTSAGPEILQFVGGNLAGSASSFISGLAQALSGSFTTSPGSLPGEAVCAPQVAGRHVSECAWADGDTFGIITSPTLTAAQLGADLKAMRPLIERVVKK